MSLVLDGLVIACALWCVISGIRNGFTGGFAGIRGRICAGIFCTSSHLRKPPLFPGKAIPSFPGRRCSFPEISFAAPAMPRNC